MKINRLKTKEILDFEKEIGYELVVNERQGDISGWRWCVDFENSRVRTDRDIVLSTTGRGSTIDDALKSYCAQISHRTLVFNVKTKNQVEINCPALVHTQKVRKLPQDVESFLQRCRERAVISELIQVHDDGTWDYWLQEGKFKPLLAIRTKSEPTYVFKNTVVTFDQFVEILEKAKF